MAGDCEISGMEDAPPTRLDQLSDVGQLVLSGVIMLWAALLARVLHAPPAYWLGDKTGRKDRSWNQILEDSLPGGLIYRLALATTSCFIVVCILHFGISKVFQQLSPVDFLVLVLVTVAIRHCLGFSKVEIAKALADRPLEIGKGCCWSYYFGYLRHMTGVNRISTRLESHSDEFRTNLSSHRLFLLLPRDGAYPPDLCEFEPRIEPVALPGGGLRSFRCMVGGGWRTFGAHRLYRVTSADGAVAIVALEEVTALENLASLSRHSFTSMSREDCQAEVDRFLDELKKAVAADAELGADVVLVTYSLGESVADKVMEQLRNVQELDKDRRFYLAFGRG